MNEEQDKRHESATLIERPEFVELDEDELKRLAKSSTLNEYQRHKLDKDAKKNWDLFYKRNGDRFFKNRYWTRHEFQELFTNSDETVARTERINLLEVGCGCGDFVIPLIQCDDQTSSCDESNLKPRNIFVYCCDISDKAIEILKNNPVYARNKDKAKAFVVDITQNIVGLINELNGQEMDIVSLIFVLSAVDPENMKKAVDNIYKVLKPGGLVLFRDYAIYDKAMLRFNERSKICDQFYVRQDGTRAYFFAKDDLVKLFEGCRFQCQSVNYVKRETINNATKDKFSRIFLQAKFKKTPRDRDIDIG